MCSQISSHPLHFSSFPPLLHVRSLTHTHTHTHTHALSDSRTTHHAWVPRRAHLFYSPILVPPCAPSSSLKFAPIRTCVASSTYTHCKTCCKPLYSIHVLIRCRRATTWRATPPTAFSQHCIIGSHSPFSCSDSCSFISPRSTRFLLRSICMTYQICMFSVPLRKNFISRTVLLPGDFQLISFVDTLT